MKVRLNLATRPLETHRRFMVGASLIATLAGLVFLGLGRHVYTIRKADEELRARSDRLHQEMLQLETQRKDLERYFGQKDIADLHDRAAFINGFLDARSVNWAQMFMDLERILPPGVRVISIEPKQVQSGVEVKLRVGATSDDAKLKFLRALEESRAFTGIQEQSDTSPSRGSGQTGDLKVVQLIAIYSRV